MDRCPPIAEHGLVGDLQAAARVSSQGVVDWFAALRIPHLPVHVLAIRAMGPHLLDHLPFEDVAQACEAEERRSFLYVIAPLRLPDATGSPVNPVAVL
ncbi:hypothetical protein ACFY04_16785 [Streptomyces sp. NPDC001549]|uniref:hypothetical protein n=1 Tax=Streptomyces sp. NPDC001549 TaxID=3364586 RepID=UPI0036D02842